jgi:hypothetical protein
MIIDFNIEEVLDYSIESAPKNKIVYSYSKLGREIYQPNVYSYCFNSDGFRSIELDPAIDIVALGCSHTLGVGLPVEYTWVNQLSSMLSRDIVNISESGASVRYLIDTFYRFYYKEKINPKIVLCNFPNFSRYKRYSLKDNMVIHEGSFMGHKDIEENLLQVAETLEALDIFELFCKKNNIQLFWTVWEYGLDEEIMNEFFAKRYKNYYYDSEAHSFEKINSWVEVDENSNVQINLHQERNSDRLILHKVNSAILHCHETKKEIYKDLFFTALDRYDLPKKYKEIHHQKKLSIEELNSLKKYLSINKSGSVHGAHHGWHRNHHWALFFYNLVKDLV